MAQWEALTDPSLTIIFATSPTGLGHLRVTEALYSGLPKAAAPVLLGAQDQSVSALYRFISINAFTRNLMETIQVPPFDKMLAGIGRKMLHSQTKLLYQQLKTILSERLIVAKTVLLIAPHAILGHQLGAIKQKMAKEMGVRIILVVQVTDDSPQPIWYVPEADMIFVPSVYTKEKLLAYAKAAHLSITRLVVAAYPVSPTLAEKLPYKIFEDRVKQIEPESQRSIQMTVPVSGAAVGTAFLSTYIQAIHKASNRFVFHVVSREAPFTKSFIQTMSKLSYVNLHTSNHDRTTVVNYEQVFSEDLIALEITKPSEQTFKALTTPRQRGGAVLLFAKPVGGQEYDNLHFLRNHGLLPGKSDTIQLWQLAKQQASLIESPLLMKARHWRGVRLPDEPQLASAFTMWCLKEKLFSAMMHFSPEQHTPELQSNGVEQFWTHIETLIK